MGPLLNQRLDPKKNNTKAETQESMEEAGYSLHSWGIGEAKTHYLGENHILVFFKPTHTKRFVHPKHNKSNIMYAVWCSLVCSELFTQEDGPA